MPEKEKNLLTKSDIFQREQFVQASSFSRRESKDIARQAHIAFCRWEPDHRGSYTQVHIPRCTGSHLTNPDTSEHTTNRIP